MHLVVAAPIQADDTSPNPAHQANKRQGYWALNCHTTANFERCNTSTSCPGSTPITISLNVTTCVISTGFISVVTSGAKPKRRTKLKRLRWRLQQRLSLRSYSLCSATDGIPQMCWLWLLRVKSSLVVCTVAISSYRTLISFDFELYRH